MSANDQVWRQFAMDLGSFDADTVEAIFTRHGAHSVTLSDAADDPVLEPAPGTTPLWRRTRICGLFSADTDLHLLQQDLQVSLALQQAPDCDIEELQDRVWEREWLRDFRPMAFGRKLWVCPTSFEVDARDAIVVHLDPGLAFGSGTHPTTAMCLTWLDGLSMHGKKVLDFGCGSGILGIAALLLGAESVVAVDIDAQAITATRQNAAQNKVLDRLTTSTDAATISGPFDVVVANILAGPLLDIAPQLCGLASSGADVALSGILEEQAADLHDTYADCVDFEPPQQTREWVCLHGTRR